MLSDVISNLLWGPYTVFAVFAAGLYLGVKTRFFYLRHPLLIISETFGKLFKKNEGKGVSPYKAMSIALGGTMGTGNITGVATAIAVGGAGAVFWMWLSAIAGMVLKYAETTLAMVTRVKVKDGYEGSPMIYIKLVPGAGIFSFLFALALLCSTFFGGNLVQTGAAAAMCERIGLPGIVTGALIAVVVVFLSFGGLKRVADALSLLVPLMTVAYLAAAFLAIWIARSELPGVLSDIISSAFGIKELGGGIAGYSLSRAMRYGMARGLFSNEAGFGTAPIAHAASSETRPAVQGMWGIVEVFIDTIVCCTATAAVVLVSPGGINPSLSGADITAGSFGALLGPYCEAMVAIFTVIFALTSILGWYVYGESAITSLLGGSDWVMWLYRSLYAVTCLIGSVMLPDLAWQLTDISSFLMLFINLPVVLILTSKVTKATEKYLKEKKGKNDRFSLKKL